MVTNGTFQFSPDFLAKGLVTVGVKRGKERALSCMVFLATGFSGPLSATPF